METSKFVTSAPRPEISKGHAIAGPIAFVPLHTLRQSLDALNGCALPSMGRARLFMSAKKSLNSSLSVSR